MARQKKEPNRVDDLLDELLEDCATPEDILEEGGLFKQIKKRLVERALSGDVSQVTRSLENSYEPMTCFQAFQNALIRKMPLLITPSG